MILAYCARLVFAAPYRGPTGERDVMGSERHPHTSMAILGCVCTRNPEPSARCNYLRTTHCRKVERRRVMARTKIAKAQIRSMRSVIFLSRGKDTRRM